MVAAFVEKRLDMGYDYGEVGGPVFETEITEFGSGHEVRNARWSDARGEWELGERRILRAELGELHAFFRARRGRLVGFRFKDWQDWEVADEVLSPDGTPTLQLVKTYTSAGVDQVRDITKPVSGTVTMKLNGSDFTSFSVDTTTGIVTFTPLQTWDIDNVSLSAPAVVTETAHGLSTGEYVYFKDISSLPASIRGKAFSITVVDADNFELDGSDTTGESYSDAPDFDEMQQHPSPADTLTWSGEFDVPVRFGTDQFRARFEAATQDGADAVYFLSSLPVIELR